MMKFPFSVSRTITFAQPEQKITSERYLRNQVEEKLLELNMTIQKIGDDELFLLKTDIFNAFRKKDFLRDLSVKIETDHSKIRIILTTQTTLFFILGLIPYTLLLLPDKRPPILFPIIVSGFIWGIGFLIKSIVLGMIKDDIINHLKKIHSS